MPVIISQVPTWDARIFIRMISNGTRCRTAYSAANLEDQKSACLARRCAHDITFSGGRSSSFSFFSRHFLMSSGEYRGL